jgi:hypothetical protein
MLFFYIILIILVIYSFYNLNFAIPKKLKEQIENQELYHQEIQRSLRKSNDSLNYLINEVKKIKEEKNS